MSNQPIEPGPHQVSLEAVSVGQPLVLGLEGLQAPAALSGFIARKDGGSGSSSHPSGKTRLWLLSDMIDVLPG